MVDRGAGWPGSARAARLRRRCICRLAPHGHDDFPAVAAARDLRCGGGDPYRRGVVRAAPPAADWSPRQSTLLVRTDAGTGLPVSASAPPAGTRRRSDTLI